MVHNIAGICRTVTEWSYTSGQRREDPFNEVELDVVVQHADGETWRVPAYWSGGQEWRVRFCAPRTGHYDVTTVCSDDSDDEMHGVKSTMTASAYTGDNLLQARGPLHIAESKRLLEHEDGTPFFWLGDTWWMGLCKRLSWPDDFQLLAADRVAKNFSVIQIVAGLYPDMPGFDERGANEAGFPWEKDYQRINPAFFDMADLRIQWLVRSGLLPCIVGCWGYYLPWLGIDKMKQHWRNLIARWGAYPVVWCLAGEATMPYYLSKDQEEDQQILLAGWTEVARYVRETDPFHRLITIHPNNIGRDQVQDDSVLDFDMLQTGHGGFDTVPNTLNTITSERERQPVMPVIIGEVNYEGIIHNNQAEVQRLTFWVSFLSGSAGYTYGANGIWQFNTKTTPYGPSPHGATWGNTPWEEAYQLPGAAQLGMARCLLQRFQWWSFKPYQQWVTPAGTAENVANPFAAGIPEKVRVIYFYNPSFPWVKEPFTVTAIEPGVSYRAYFWDPCTGDEYDLGAVQPDENGNWPIPIQPAMQDWVLVLENEAVTSIK